jgi:hypothetical protein
MPSLSSRTVSMPDWMRAQQRAPDQPITTHHPTPAPVYLGRSPVMISSMPGIAATQDGAMRQFYGGRVLPSRRVSQR